LQQASHGLGFLKETPSVLLFLTNGFALVCQLAQIDRTSAALSPDWKNHAKNITLISIPFFATLQKICHGEVS
jgi:hypothetical protein